MLDKIPNAEEMIALVGQSLYDIWNKLCTCLLYTSALEADYESMKDMLYGDVPTFGAVINAVRELEKEINML